MDIDYFNQTRDGMNFLVAALAVLFLGFLTMNIKKVLIPKKCYQMTISH